MASSSLEPRALPKADWKSWNKIAWTLAKRIGKSWLVLVGVLTGIGVLAWLTTQVQGANQQVVAGLLISILCIPVGLCMACAGQRFMERARRGLPPKPLRDTMDAATDVLTGSWGIWRLLVVMTIMALAGALIVSLMMAVSTDAEATSTSMTIGRALYFILFGGLLTNYMFRGRGVLMDFGYFLGSWHKLDREEADALAELGSQRNRHLGASMGTLPTFPIWGWVILNSIGFPEIAIVGTLAHFLWLVAMDYIIYQEIFEGGCKIEAKQVVEQRVKQTQAVMATR